jgi:hypothetical protein
MAASFFKIGEVGIALGGGLYTIDLSTGGGGVAGLTHTVTVEYVDGSGVKQTATATPDAGASITVPLGSPMWLDATASRSTETNADTEGEAWTSLGNRFDSGEALGGTWSLSGAAKDVVTGAGVAGHVYTTAGTFTLRHWLRDSAGRQSFADFTVTVPAMAAGTDINTGGSWPTWASNTVYNLAAGTDHTAKGAINLNGLHNVVIRKTGAGADPLVGAVNWHTVNASDVAQSRTRGCRLIGIDAASVNESSVGSLYCAIVGGRCRSYETSADQYYWENEAATQTAKNNICRPRGLTLWNCGEINSNSSNYVLIFTAKNFTARNVDFRKTTGDSGQHVFRGWYEGLDFRHNRFRASVATSSFNKITGADNVSAMDAWPADDTLGVWNGALYQPVCRKIVLGGNVYGASGGTTPSAQEIECCPENDVGASGDQALELIAIEDNIFFQTTDVQVWFSGRHMQHYNNKYNMGAGAEVPYSYDVRLLRTPSGWEGPYPNSARPVVVP